ncbi:MAG TPA: hypothetical protein PKM48_07615 [Parvularculaceae bacterium]|nr:hypothetical protein [Parvularculaceae bacterium]HNS85312.1 hypothetical protein [Parvularculaceae bacterium]
MTIEEMLAKDFSALKARFADDAFVSRVIAKLTGADRLRLIVVGGAGVIGAAIAAAQFPALVSAFADAAPAIAELPLAESAIAFDVSAAPLLAAALLFAFVGGATALVLPGAR